MSQTLATVRRRRRDLVLAGVVVCGERAREHGRVDDLEVGAQPHCPECGTVLADRGRGLECRGCGLSFPFPLFGGERRPS